MQQCDMETQPDGRIWRATPLAILLMAWSSASLAAPGDRFELLEGRLQKRVNGILALMSYSVVPDITTSSLSINNASSGNPEVMMTQFGGGFTWSKETRLYLEGAAAYSRYDPTFVATNGDETREIPVKWNSLTGTAGIGWDFPITEDKEWVLRPIFNFALGYVASDLNVANWYIERNTERELDFLDGGKMKAYGLGGSVMLDYEHYRPTHEIDVEMRYTSIQLKSFDGTAEAVRGKANSQTAGIWARWRAPTGFTMLNKPVRYVVEGAHSHFYGSQAGVLGFTYMSSVGLGLELDTSNYNIWVTRARMVARYAFGNDVSGVSVGLAVSF